MPGILTRAVLPYTGNDLDRYGHEEEVGFVQPRQRFARPDATEEDVSRQREAMSRQLSEWLLF